MVSGFYDFISVSYQDCVIIFNRPKRAVEIKLLRAHKANLIDLTKIDLSGNWNQIGHTIYKLYFICHLVAMQLYYRVTPAHKIQCLPKISQNHIVYILPFVLSGPQSERY